MILYQSIYIILSLNMLQYRFMQLLPLFSFLFQIFIFSYLSFQIRFRTMLWSSKNNHTGILVGIGLNFSIHFSRIDICVILSPSRQEQDTHLFFSHEPAHFLLNLFPIFYFLFILLPLLTDSLFPLYWLLLLCKKATNLCIFIL